MHKPKVMLVNEKVWCSHHNCLVTILDLNEGSPTGKIRCQFEDGRTQSIPKTYLLSLKKQVIVTNEVVIVIAYGHHVVDKYPHCRIEDGQLRIGGKLVENYDESVFKGKIPLLYIVRGADGSFIGGFDLINGKFWSSIVDGTHYLDPKQIFREIDAIHHGFRLYVEGETQLS